MRGLVQGTYFAALALWIPLAIIAARHPSLRRRLATPLIASALGAAYEAYMTYVWAPTVVNPIRVDIFLLMAVLAGIDLFAGFKLFSDGRTRPPKSALRLSGLLCLAVPALVAAAFVAMAVDTASVDRNLDSARRFRFEAFFRDNDTEKRAFGDLKPNRNPFAGYYEGIGTDDRFAHLVVNDEGHFWIYHSQLYESKGKGAPSPGSNELFEGADDARGTVHTHMTLRRQENGPYLLDVQFGGMPNPPASTPSPMRKADPPRFPRPASAGDDVHFAGVFSATYEEREKGFWLTQVWLWESGGEWWGRYLRDYYTHGDEREFIATDEITAACSEQCKVLSFTTSRGPVVLTRISDTELSANMAGVSAPVTLKRGETLPGFFYDLAPVATKSENRQWLKALTTAGMISWKVP